MLKEIFSDQKAIEYFMKVWGDGKQGTTKEHGKKLAVINILKLLPFPVQATLETESTKVWTVLNAESLQVSATSLFLKYGNSLSGTWNILGMLDAMPDESLPAKQDSDPQTLVELMDSFESLSVSLGRPRNAFGVTPLLIFRQVEASLDT